MVATFFVLGFSYTSADQVVRGGADLKPQERSSGHFLAEKHV